MSTRLSPLQRRILVELANLQLKGATWTNGTRTHLVAGAPELLLRVALGVRDDGRWRSAIIGLDQRGLIVCKTAPLGATIPTRARMRHKRGRIVLVEWRGDDRMTYLSVCCGDVTMSRFYMRRGGWVPHLKLTPAGFAALNPDDVPQVRPIPAKTPTKSNAGRPVKLFSADVERAGNLYLKMTEPTHGEFERLAQKYKISEASLRRYVKNKREQVNSKRRMQRGVNP